MAPEDLLRALADPERLAIAGALARSSATASDLAASLGLPITRVRRHLTRLGSVGLAVVGSDRRTWTLVPEALRDAAREIGPNRDAGLALGAVDEEEESVLRSYFRGGALREIPAKQSKRTVILTRLAMEFEAGVRYPEREVNEILKRFHPDYVSLRRYLIDEGLLSRDKGQYWRTGGPVEV
jgi:hypothetical protein